MSMYPGGFGYGGYGGGFGGYGSYNPTTATGVAGQVVQIGPEFSTPLTPLERTTGELGKNIKSRNGMVIGGLSGMAAGAAGGALIGGPVGMVIGGLAGLFGGGLAGKKIGNLVAVQKDVHNDGKVDGDISTKHNETAQSSLASLGHGETKNTKHSATAPNSSVSSLA